MKIGANEAVPHLIKLMGRTSGGADAAEALVQIGDNRAAQPLANYVINNLDNRGNRDYCLKFVLDFGEPAVSILRARLEAIVQKEEESEQRKQSATEVLQQLGAG